MNIASVHYRLGHISRAVRRMAMERIVCIVFSVVLLTAGCAANGTAPIGGGHLSVSMIDKDDPEKSFGEVMLERIAEGNFKRRVIGWIDRAT